MTIHNAQHVRPSKAIKVGERMRAELSKRVIAAMLRTQQMGWMSVERLRKLKQGKNGAMR